jgi:hypothetical protein
MKERILTPDQLRNSLNPICDRCTKAHKTSEHDTITQKEAGELNLICERCGKPHKTDNCPEDYLGKLKDLP